MNKAHLVVNLSILLFISLSVCPAETNKAPRQQAAPAEASANIRLSKWQRGLSVDSMVRLDMRMYLWFYEWQLFDAIEKGQMTHGIGTGRDIVLRDRQSGKITLPTIVSEDHLSGSVVAAERGLKLDMKAVSDGAVMTLTVTNRSDHEWPKLAAIIPCFSPGPETTRNRQFANTHTYFNSPRGLRPLAMKTPREIHFNHRHHDAVESEADNRGKYAWSFKWPKSDVDAMDGLIVRESKDRRWVTGIAWERFVSVQGHNPWQCMHLSINIGPLKRGETRIVRGRIYLFQGTKETLLARYQKDFERH